MRALSTLVLALIAAVPSAAPASPPPSAALFAHRHVRAWQPPAVVSAAMRVAIDPETGQLGPVRVEAMPKAERAALKAYEAARAGLQEVLRPDGSAVINVDGVIRAYTVVRVGPGGRLVEDCVQSPLDAMRLMRTPVAPAPAATER